MCSMPYFTVILHLTFMLAVIKIFVVVSEMILIFRALIFTHALNLQIGKNLDLLPLFRK